MQIKTTSLGLAQENLELPLAYLMPPRPSRPELKVELESFREFGQPTRSLATQFQGPHGDKTVPTFVNEFWTARQCAAHSLHEVSYRACFKPQLPRFFIERLTQPEDIVYDPFMGRGTTLLEASLLGRVPFGCDINPLSAVLTQGRLRPPFLTDVATRLQEIDFGSSKEFPEELLTFYHPETLRQIVALKEYLVGRRESRNCDPVDD